MSAAQPDPTNSSEQRRQPALRRPRGPAAGLEDSSNVVMWNADTIRAVIVLFTRCGHGGRARVDNPGMYRTVEPSADRERPLILLVEDQSELRRCMRSSSRCQAST